MIIFLFERFKRFVVFLRKGKWLPHPRLEPPGGTRSSPTTSHSTCPRRVYAARSTRIDGIFEPGLPFRFKRAPHEEPVGALRARRCITFLPWRPGCVQSGSVIGYRPAWSRCQAACTSSRRTWPVKCMRTAADGRAGTAMGCLNSILFGTFRGQVTERKAIDPFRSLYLQPYNVRTSSFIVYGTQ